MSALSSVLYYGIVLPFYHSSLCCDLCSLSPPMAMDRGLSQTLYVICSAVLQCNIYHPSIVIHSAPTSSHDCNSQKVVYCCVFPSGWLSVRVLSLSLSPVQHNILWCTYEQIINSMISFHPSILNILVLNTATFPHWLQYLMVCLLCDTISWLSGILVV